MVYVYSAVHFLRPVRVTRIRFHPVGRVHSLARAISRNSNNCPLQGETLDIRDGALHEHLTYVEDYIYCPHNQSVTLIECPTCRRSRPNPLVSS